MTHENGTAREPQAPRESAPQAASPRMQRCALHRFEDGRLFECEDNVGVEEEIEIRVPGRDPIALSRTPGQDEALVLGTLFTRGLIRKPSDVAALSFSEYGAQTRAQVAIAVQEPRRLSLVAPPPPDSERPDHEMAIQGAERIFGLREAFEARQRIYRITGSMHGAALFNRQGTLLAFAEDIGRHNALDKVIGEALLQGTLHRAEIALLSSRLALELTMKAAMAGLNVLVGLSVATRSSVELAAARGITLIGRLKRRGMNIYTHPWRLATLAGASPQQASESPHEHRTLHLRGI